VATVQSDEGFYAELDVRVRVKPRAEIVFERLSADVGSKHIELLVSESARPESSDLEAAVWNGKKGRNPRLSFRSSHLLTSQLPLRMAGDNTSERQLITTARTVLGVLGGVFHLDPVPHLMRDYVPEQDVELRRTVDNLSATIARLKREGPEDFAELLSIVQQLPEREIRGIDVGRGPFGEVMIALREGRRGSDAVIPTRPMSDGMLRMLAIATALLSGGSALDLDPALGR
jgi:hypothetical protein